MAVYTLTSSVAGDETRITNANPTTTIDVPNDAQQPTIVPGMIFMVTKISESVVTIVPNSGVTINSSGPFTLNDTGDTVRLIKVGVNNWDMQFISAPPLPTQTGNSGKFLTTDGASASWATVAGGGLVEPLNQVVYGTGDSVTSDIELTFDSTTSTLTVGTDPLATGIIRSSVNADLEISTTGTGKIILSTELDGQILLNNYIWPVSAMPPTVGMYLGVLAAPYTLGFLPAPGSLLTIKTIATDYTLDLTDSYNVLIRIIKATAATVTIPNDATADLPIGSAVLIGWNGLGEVTIVGAGGVTVDTPDTNKIGRRFGKITAIKTGANHWEIEGNLEPV